MSAVASPQAPLTSLQRSPHSVAGFKGPQEGKKLEEEVVRNGEGRGKRDVGRIAPWLSRGDRCPCVRAHAV